MRLILSLFLLLFYGFAHGQVDVTEDYSWHEPRPADSLFYAKRSKISIPPYGREKIKRLIDDKAKQLPDGILEGYDAGISAKDFNALTFNEKFTYTMLYPEIFSQACAEFMYYHDPQTKIFAHLPLHMTVDYWSERQLDFINKNKTEVITLLKENIPQVGFGVNFKHAIIEMNAWEMIPFLTSYFKRNSKDNDVLTVLMLLLNKGEDEKFASSIIYKRLYSDESNYFSAVDKLPAMEKIIIETATSYYNKKKKK